MSISKRGTCLISIRLKVHCTLHATWVLCDTLDLLITQTPLITLWGNKKFSQEAFGVTHTGSNLFRIHCFGIISAKSAATVECSVGLIWSALGFACFFQSSGHQRRRSALKRLTCRWGTALQLNRVAFYFLCSSALSKTNTRCRLLHLLVIWVGQRLPLLCLFAAIPEYVGVREMQNAATRRECEKTRLFHSFEWIWLHR